MHVLTEISQQPREGRFCVSLSQMRNPRPSEMSRKSSVEISSPAKPTSPRFCGAPRGRRRRKTRRVQGRVASSVSNKTDLKVFWLKIALAGFRSGQAGGRAGGGASGKDLARGTPEWLEPGQAVAAGLTCGPDGWRLIYGSAAAIGE